MRGSGWIAAVVMMVSLVGCTTQPVAPDLIHEVSAQSSIDAGDYRAAGAEFERLAGENRKLRDYYLLRAAESWREEAEFGEVARLLGEIRRKKLDRSQSLRLDLVEAELALSRKDPARASALLMVAEDEIPGRVRERWHEVLARALWAEGRVEAAARSRLRLIDLLPATERSEAQTDLLKLLAGREPQELKSLLQPLAVADPLRPWLERALRQNGEFPARAPLEAREAVGDVVLSADGTRTTQGRESLGQVAVLLPLRGEFAAAGRVVLDGVMTAHFADPAAASLRVYDAGGTRRSALEALVQARKDGAREIIGPVERDQVDAVLQEAGPDLRVLALNQPDPAVLAPARALRFGLLPEDEAAYAAELLVAEGVRKVAIFAVAEDWSERASNALSMQLEALGAEISGRRLLRDSDVDFADAIEALVGAPGAALEERKADAIFLALRPGTARLLVPQLRAAGFLDLPVIATSHVYSGSTQALADRDLDGLVFLDAPWSHLTMAGLPDRAALADVASVQGSARLFAFGLDAYRLLPYAAYLQQAPGRYLVGASGQLLVDPFGRVRRLPQLFRFSHGMAQAAQAIRVIAPASEEADPASPEVSANPQTTDPVSP